MSTTSNENDRIQSLSDCVDDILENSAISLPPEVLEAAKDLSAAIQTFTGSRKATSKQSVTNNKLDGAENQDSSALGNSATGLPHPTTAIADAIREHFGNPCPEYAEHCAICDVWNHFYRLLSSEMELRALQTKVAITLWRCGAISLDDVVSHVNELAQKNDFLTEQIQKTRQKNR